MNQLIKELRKKLVISEELFEKKLKQLNISWHQLARQEARLTFEQIQLGIICADRLLWAAAFLKEPDSQEPFKPYVFWDYQKDSIRFSGDSIHQDGAEVGKTREIVVRIMHPAFVYPRSQSLVGAPEQVHLDDIISAIDEQLFHLNPSLGKDLSRHQKHPHHVFHFKNRARIYLSPAGFDGTGFRGKHVNAELIMEEAAKIKNPDVWSEFFRAGKPGVRIGIYSVPDGDRTSTYYRLTQKAKSASLPPSSPVIGGTDFSLSAVRKDGNPPPEQSLPTDKKFRLFVWKKTDQPPPFWTPQRRRHFIDLYGGEDSSGYRRNVLGEHGDPENSVFLHHQFEKCLKNIPEYLSAKIVIAGDEVSLFVARYKTTKSPAGKPIGEEEIITDLHKSKADFRIDDTIRSIFSNLSGIKIIGADLGFSKDPTEIFVIKIIGAAWRLVARLQLRGVTYDIQELALDTLDSIFAPAGIGIDAGNAGSALLHSMQADDAYPDKNYDDRLTGFMFGASMEDIDETGEAKLDPKTDKPLKKPTKEVATDILVRKMQRSELELPFDTELVNDFTSHTYRQGPRYRIFSKENDHTVDALRAATLKIVTPLEQIADAFSVGAFHR